MTAKDLSALAGLLDAKQREAQFSLAEVTQEEGRIHRLLDGLRSRDSRAKAAFDDGPELRAMGLDLAWSHWSSERHKELNMQLAMQRARREQALLELQRAFGKHQAVGLLLQEAQKARHTEDLRLETEKLQSLTMLFSMHSG